MLGAITGDVVGSAYEFHNTKDYKFEMFPKGASFTDDSVMTLAERLPPRSDSSREALRKIAAADSGPFCPQKTLKGEISFSGTGGSPSRAL